MVMRKKALSPRMLPYTPLPWRNILPSRRRVNCGEVSFVTYRTRFYQVFLSIESHFVGVHGRYELHRKEEQIKCTALAVHENLLFFPMQFISPVNTDKMRFNTYIYIFLQQSLSRYCLL